MRIAWLLVLAGAGTSGAAPLSTLEPAGQDAAVIADLFWWMAWSSAIVWAASMGVLFYCLVAPRRRATVAVASPARRRANRRLVWGGGVVVPILALTALLGNALPPVERIVDGPASDGLRVHVDGEQWWWRVRYPQPDGGHVELANELRIPRGQTTHLELASDNVIHAFWVPSLAGKIDMVPGRTTYLTLEPTTAGTFRGICAEYCGTSHARMAFTVVVVEPDDFQAWLQHEGAAAPSPTTAHARTGATLFSESGCGACHAVRGTEAIGAIGPDLTHVANRHGLADPLRPGGEDELEAWIRQPHHAKPGALMPSFAALGDVRIAALTAYLRDLR